MSSDRALGHSSGQLPGPRLAASLGQVSAAL